MKWWGNYQLSSKTWARWQIGPLTLYARPASGEWLTAYLEDRDASAQVVSIELHADTVPDESEYVFARHAVSYEKTEVELSVRLADRPFVVNPEQSLFLLAGQSTVLYVSTIIWVQLRLGPASGESLLEIPAVRRSDTWFGPNTREGQLCYASRSNARTDPEQLQASPHRATTPIEIRNEGSTALPIERLLVPVPALSLYADAESRLWTDSVCFVREDGDIEAKQSISEDGKHLPAERTTLSEPRNPVEAGTIVQAFSRLLS